MNCSCQGNKTFYVAVVLHTMTKKKREQFVKERDFALGQVSREGDRRLEGAKNTRQMSLLKSCFRKEELL